MTERPHQELRPSQFITTFGPGSLLETRSGPVVIKSADQFFRNIGRGPEDFEIVDERLSRAELGGARIVALPSNAQLNQPEDQYTYPTFPFPYWCLCTRHGTDQILYQAGDGCPRCPSVMPAWARLEKAGREAIRFVLACQDGHLDDVNWHRLVHGSARGCTPDHYMWRGGGRALRFVDLQCPDCGATENLGRAYGRPWSCSTRLPEVGPRPATTSCPRDAHILQRGAANLRIAEVKSALTILDMPERLHMILKDRALLTAADLMRRYGLLNQAAFLEEARRASVNALALDVLSRTPWPEIEHALDDLLRARAGSPVPVKDEEFERLEQAATHGAPPGLPNRPGDPPLFEVPLRDVRLVDGPAGHLRFRVAPVSRLRMVLVQTGYQRLDPAGAPVVPVSFTWGGHAWYPGVELFGEGIYVDLGGAALPLAGGRADVWSARHAAAPPGVQEQHPAHVWWHTLAHRLLRTLSVDSGYSSASIRERVYLAPAPGGYKGGVLLYTVQPGGDGTLGGLIALVSRFDEILAASVRDLDRCSNDPLCEESPTAGSDGAACYACLLASETSCEHRNLGLDRLLLLENAP